MGFLDIFKKAPTATMLKLPSGSFTVDPKGHIVASTLPQSFPEDGVKRVANLVLATFKSAQEASVPMNEMMIEFASFKIKAKELRGGAMIFLTPKQLGQR